MSFKMLQISVFPPFSLVLIEIQWIMNCSPVGGLKACSHRKAIFFQKEGKHRNKMKGTETMSF